MAMSEKPVGSEEAAAVAETAALRQRAKTLGVTFTGRAETEADTAREFGAAVDAHNRSKGGASKVRTDFSDPMKKSTADFMSAPVESGNSNR